MRVFWVVGILIAAAMSVHSEECAVDVIVHVDGMLPVGVLKRAEISTTTMFAEIGVRVRLRTGGPGADSSAAYCPSITAILESNVPIDVMPRVLGYAAPYAVSGTRIHVFVNRIIKDHQADLAQVLAHVLVHEIAHVLQGSCRHSKYGIMKANWEERDFVRMRFEPLPFTDWDVQLIHRAVVISEKPMTDSAAESSSIR